MKYKIFIAIFLIIFSYSAHADQNDQKKGHTTKTGQSSKQEKQLRITSDSMLVEKTSNIIRFSGNVVVTQQNAVIHADTITITLLSDKEKKAKKSDVKQDIKKMVASGNVEFTSDDKSAFADKAVYTASDQKLVLTGKAPKVITGESYVTGKKITIHQNSGRVTVEGDGAKRVEALFNSKDNFTLENNF